MSSLSKIVNKFSILKQLPIFGKLKWFELQKIANNCTFVEYKKGEIIREQGSPADAFYCVISGRIHAYTTFKSGEKKDVEFIHRGMYFGIISILTGETHSLTFEAINDSVILKIEKEDFLSILESVPRLGIEFSQSLSRRVRSRYVDTKSIFESTVISIYGPVKASGSSTYALNLALSLERETKKKVIFVSIDSTPKGHAPLPGTQVDATPRWKKESINLKNIIDSHQKIMDSITRGSLAIDVLNVVFDPQDFSALDQISYFISLLATDYHFVVVDLPNEMDDFVFKTLTQSDIVQLVTKSNREDLRLTAHVIERLKRTLREKFAKEKIQVMLSGVDSSGPVSIEEMNKILNYNMTQVLPHMTPEELKVTVSSEEIIIKTPDLQSAYAQAVRKIARQIGGVLVGLVLGGGAALGIAHIGVLRILERENIPIDMVVGSSIGALIGSLWVTGKSADDIEKIAREFETKAAMGKLLDFTFPKSGIIGGESITRWLKRHLGDRTFYTAKVPFKAIAYDLIKREELIIDEGIIVDAVRQSIAIPGVIKPIVKKDRLIIDGGVVNPLPTNVVASLGIKKIIAVNVLQSPGDVIQGYEIFEKQMKEEEKIPFAKSPVKFIGIRMHRLLAKLFYPNIADIIVRGLQAVEYVIAEQNAQQADVLIHPDLIGVNWFELYQVGRIIKSGEEAALKHLPEIKKLISE